MFDKDGNDYNSLVTELVGTARGGRVLAEALDYLRNVNDAAQVTDGPSPVALTPTGGIDFGLDNFNMEIDFSGPGVQINFDPAMLQKGNFGGLVPVILNVTPISDLPMFLGAAREPEKELAGAGV